MFATIRRYTYKAGAVEEKTMDELKRRIESGFMPMVQNIPGFHGYFVVNAGNRELITISLFDNRSGAAESTRRAAEFVRQDPIKDQLRTPEVIEGELLLSREAPVGSH